VSTTGEYPDLAAVTRLLDLATQRGFSFVPRLMTRARCGVSGTARSGTTWCSWARPGPATRSAPIEVTSPLGPLPPLSSRGPVGTTPDNPRSASCAATAA
jgi:hypothetical protein